jgi:hypothetical protein
MSMYALRFGVQFLAKDTGNYAPVKFTFRIIREQRICCLALLFSYYANYDLMCLMVTSSLTTICNPCRD